MSFRDNLQHLRATRNMTQEQLAMLLGVSRQSVSKWEAERAYPEMDKLLRLCDLFDCTLDELVCGDATERSAEEAACMPEALAPQDVTGYDEVMRAFAWKMPLGAAVAIAGAALAVLLSDPALVPGGLHAYASALVFIGAAAGLAVLLPAAFARSGFRKAHPFVEDFYTADRRSRARAGLLRGLVVGIGLVMMGLAATVLLQARVYLASAAFLAFLAAGVFFIARGWLLASRCDVERYNRISLGRMDEAQIGALDDEELAARVRQARRERSVYAAVMCAATAVGLVMLFTPASRWFFLAWPVGGLVCAVIKALRS
ncbi:helix-turn-helix transcriptional regulator [Arabiibacter massiliensis]|uniref:helix-turn-helix transcriptional regulator n=1 Tax=Arabiibacter massiliensis TaxID=1870985 RepID=UPI0009BB1DEA|nr:helix-turn-helix transcriptional regulator [Arabiibacter massiliensis]